MAGQVPDPQEEARPLDDEEVGDVAGGRLLTPETIIILDSASMPAAPDSTHGC